MRKDRKESRKREDNWKRYPYLFNQQKDLAFECECGKRYMSFPGLYLHFQRKHDHKISTKPEENEYQKSEDTNGVTYKYIVPKKQAKNSQSSCQESFNAQPDALSKLLKDFMGQVNRNLKNQAPQGFSRPSLGQYEQYIGMFEKFLREQKGRKQEHIGKQAIENLPNCFNDFVLAMRQDASQEKNQEKYICFVLFDLWKWMESNNLTELKVEYLGEQEEEQAEDPR